MASVALEEKWWTDIRRSALIEELKSELIVDGLAVKLFRVAQGYWKSGRGGIPQEIFNLIPHKESLVRVGLVTVQGSFVFVRGSLEHLDWLRVHSENASQAGKKSAEARLKKSGSAQPKIKKARSNAEPTPNGIQPVSNQTEPTTNPSTSSSPKENTTTTTSFPKDLPKLILKAWDTYGDTLEKLGTPRRPMGEMDERSIAQAIRILGHQNVLDSLEGPRYEKPTDGFTPGNYVSLDYCLHKNAQTQKSNWERLGNLTRKNRKRFEDEEKARKEAQG